MNNKQSQKCDVQIGCVQFTNFMWETIKKNGFVVYMHLNRGVFSIPEGSSLLTANQLLKMQEWIFEEFIKDCDANRDLLQVDPKDYRKEQDFINRNASRTLSYVNQSCLIEGVLQRSYKDMFGSLRRYVDPSVKYDLFEHEARTAEVADLFDFRNMVSAHTVYGSPKPGDNPSLEFSSLTALLSSSFNGGVNTFALGAVKTILGGDAPSRTIPTIALGNLHPRMIRHYKSWENMFASPLQSLFPKLPIQKTDYTVIGPGQKLKIQP